MVPANRMAIMKPRQLFIDVVKRTIAALTASVNPAVTGQENLLPMG